MKNPLLLSSLLLALLAGCNPPARVTDASESNFVQALNAYLDKRGDLCVNRSTWPVDVTREEAQQGSRNSVQLPVLERLGLVHSTAVEVEVGEPDAKKRTSARRYELTDAGRKFYVARTPYKRDPGHPVADHDFCAAHLSLKHIVRWDTPSAQGPGAQTVVTYTYDVAPAPWTSDAEVRRVFPMVDRVLRGAGSMELKEPMLLTAEGWEAKDL
jgi:hypothetical protein